MVAIICVKLLPGLAFSIASRVMVDTAFGADCTDIKPPPNDNDCACTVTSDSCFASRWVALDVVVLEVLEALTRCWLAALFCVPWD